MKKLVLVAIAAVIVLPGLAGVVEAQGPTLVVTKAADTADGQCDSDCSLREAVIEANRRPGHDTIVLPFRSHSDTYTLSRKPGGSRGLTGSLYVTDDLTIQADEGTRLNAYELDDRVFHVLEADLEIHDLSIRGGYAATRGGAAILNEGGKVLLNDTLIMDNFSITGGGAISNLAGPDQEGSMTIRDSSLLNNSAYSGAGGILSDTSLTIDNSYVAGNLVQNSGDGAIRSLGDAVLTISNSLVGFNTGALAGCGGIYTESPADIENTQFPDNRIENPLEADRPGRCIDEEADVTE